MTSLWFWFPWSAESTTTGQVTPVPLPPTPLPGPMPSGGITTSSDDPEVRPRFSAAEIARFLPERGRFVFPRYGTTGIRLTNERDTEGQDGVNPVGYSYWRNINAHAGNDYLFVLLSLERRRGGQGPSLFSVDKHDLTVEPLGPLFLPSDPLSWSEAEGWYWSARDAVKFYYLDSGSLRRYDLRTKSAVTVFSVPGYTLWQTHSSADDRVHCATIRESNGAYAGAVVYFEDRNETKIFERRGIYDESQLDKSGRYLVIKEDGDNRIIDLFTGTETRIADMNGAVGHSDTGFGTVIGEDDYAANPGAMRLWELGNVSAGGRELYHMIGWTPMARHVAFGGDFVLISSAHRDALPRANELVKVPFNGTPVAVAPNLIDLNATGGSDDYRKLPKANVDVTGRYAVWTTNLGGPRLEAMMVVIP